MQLQANDIPLVKTGTVEQIHTNFGGSKSTTFYVAQNLQPCLKESITRPCPPRDQSLSRPPARFPYDPF